MSDLNSQFDFLLTRFADAVATSSGVVSMLEELLVEATELADTVTDAVSANIASRFFSDAATACSKNPSLSALKDEAAEMAVVFEDFTP